MSSSVVLLVLILVLLLTTGVYYFAFPVYYLFAFPNTDYAYPTPKKAFF